MTDEIEFTIVMPCLNEAETLASCIEKARTGIQRSGTHGEILVADNGSRDSSVQIAEELGARVVQVKKKGYGNYLDKMGHNLAQFGLRAVRRPVVSPLDRNGSADIRVALEL